MTGKRGEIPGLVFLDDFAFIKVRPRRRTILGNPIKKRPQWWPLFNNFNRMDILLVTQITRDEDKPLKLAFWTRQFALNTKNGYAVDMQGRTIDQSLVIDGRPELCTYLFMLPLPRGANIQEAVDKHMAQWNENMRAALLGADMWHVPAGTNRGTVNIDVETTENRSG